MKILGAVLNCQRPNAAGYQRSYFYDYGATSAQGVYHAADERANDAA